MRRWARIAIAAVHRANQRNPRNRHCSSVSSIKSMSMYIIRHLDGSIPEPICGKGWTMPRRRVPIRHSALVGRFSERLREVRQSLGKTQAELARDAHVTTSYVSRLEGGKVAPGIDMVERLASALATTVNDLLPTAATPDPLPAMKEQTRRLVDVLLEKGDRDTFVRMNPYLALLVESCTKRR
jgi:transcriptional regulator with XRE-family HTH domain